MHHQHDLVNLGVSGGGELSNSDFLRQEHRHRHVDSKHGCIQLEPVQRRHVLDGELESAGNSAYGGGVSHSDNNADSSQHGNRVQQLQQHHRDNRIIKLTV